MRKRLSRILLRFAITIVIVLAIGGLISLYSGTLSQAQQDKVLIKAVPFVAIFVSIVLAFICLIVVVAVTLEGKVPQRSYRPIEYLLIAGILLGVLGLFQGWKLFAYEFGFLLLLFSLASFMVWSHLAPMPAHHHRALPPLTRTVHAIALVAALLVWAGATFYIANDNKPREPYGFGKTLWDMKNDEEKTQIKSDAENEYQNSKIPVFMLIGLLPAGLVYFGAREIAAARVVDAPSIPAKGLGVPSG